MRRSGRTLWVLLWLTAVTGALCASPARAAERERVLLLGVIENHDHLDTKLTEGLLARLRGEPESILRGADLTKRPICAEPEDPDCFSEEAKNQNAQAVLIVTVTPQGDKQRLLHVSLYDTARKLAKGPSDKVVGSKTQLDQLVSMVQTALKQRREAPAPPVASAEPTPPPYAPVDGSSGGAVDLGGSGGGAPPPVIGGLTATAPRGTNRWNRMPSQRRWLVVGLSVASLGLIAGATALAVMDNKATMGPCTFDGNSDFRNCVTDYRGLYGTMFAGAGIGVGASLYLVFKK